MKAVAYIIDFIVLGVLVFGMYALMGDTYTKGSILTKALLMGAVGAIYGLLRAIYRKYLISDDEDKKS